jgi:starch synthase
VSGREELHVVTIASEVHPFAKTGGLADVTGALPPALARLGVRVSTVMPGYTQIRWAEIGATDTGVRVRAPISDRTEEAAVWQVAPGNGQIVYFLRADRYFARGGLYGTPAGDYPDNAERFAFFSRAALALSATLVPVHVVHCHDWQAALVPAFLRANPERADALAAARTVLTVHNLGYQGLFWSLDWHLLNLDWRLFNPAQLEFYGKINYLKGGLVFSDAITTVSRKYAEEIQTPEFGHGLDGVLRERSDRLTGILNGVDYGEWTPETDPHLRARYAAGALGGKAVCKGDLQDMFGLDPRPDVPVLGLVSRLVDQKGCDLLAAALDELFARDIQLVILGSGDQAYQDLFAALPARYPRRAGVHIGFDDTLAHKIEGGADLFLMPSRYEPCGLNQMYSLRYGTIPVVRATGGLDDTVIEFDPDTGTGTGFKFGPYTAAALLDAVDRALATYRAPGHWRRLLANAMAQDFSWERAARAYVDLYHRLAGGVTA